MLEWKERRVNDIPTNPRDCYWAVGKIFDSPRLYRIVEQHPVKEDGYTIVSGSEPELYVLFEEIRGRSVGNVFTDEKELLEWKNATEWDGCWFKGRGEFVRAFKTLDQAKKRAEVQLDRIRNLIETYCPRKEETK